MKKFPLNIAAIVFLIGTSTSATTAFGAEADRQLFKVKMAPLGNEVLVTDIQVNPSELADARQRHASVPNGDVVPCLTDNAWVSSKYSRVNDLIELRIATDEVKTFYSGYGKTRSYPLQVTPKEGEAFIASSSVPGSAAQSWALCKATGDFKWHAFAFEKLIIRIVNSNDVLNLKTLEVMALKNLSLKEQDDLKTTEIQDFQKAADIGTKDAVSRFIVRYKFSDIAKLVTTAEQRHQQMFDAENAPILEKQAKQAQERARQNAEATNAFRSSITTGVESNCGPIIEIKGDLVKVYHPVANFGTEHWIRRDVLFQAGNGCRFENGTYQGR